MMYNWKAANIPNEPGVYMMRSDQGRILYVGKAKNLRARIRQYFQEGGDGREMIPHLIQQIADIETIVAISEKDALLLENSLIKQHKPKYNVLLKDDKTYISLVINPKEMWPRLKLMRFKGKPRGSGLFFGPYTSAMVAKQTYETLLKAFPLRQCTDRELKSRTRPCLLHSMHRCIAPCVQLCTKEEYQSHVNQVIRFLRGYDLSLIKELEEKRDHLSEQLEFEKAKETHQQIQALRQIHEHHRFTTRFDLPDTDVLALYQGENGSVAVGKLLIREGHFAKSVSFHIPLTLQSPADILTSFILQHYVHISLPHQILVQYPQPKVLEEILDANHSVKILSPIKGEKKKLIAMAEKNAKVFLLSHIKREQDTQELLLKLQEMCHLNRFPERIECFDTSHLSQDNPVASMAVFIGGKKVPSESRKYKIKHAEKAEDYSSMREVLTRRLQRGQKEDNLPDLIILDGGKGQLNIAKKVLDELNLIQCDVIALAKENARHDKGLTREKIYLLNRSDPIALPPTSSLHYFLQKVRDESHEIAIRYHRKQRKEALLRSALDDIPGIGPKKKRLLLSHFGSLKRIQEATQEELECVKGITKADILALLEYL